MTNFYVSKPVDDALKEEIENEYQTYLTSIEDASGLTLRSIETIKYGTDYQAKGLIKPFILIDPRRMDVDDEAVGIVSARFIYDVVFAYDGFDEEDAVVATKLYADAFISMVISDDFFGGNLDHASVKNVEYYPGSSSVGRYAVLELELTLEIER